MMSRLANRHTNPTSHSLRNVWRKTSQLLRAPLTAKRPVIDAPTRADLERDRRDTEPQYQLDLPLQGFFDEAPAILFVASQQGIIQYCNNFLLGYSGLSPANASRTAIIDLIHPRDRRLVAVASARAAEVPSPFSVACRLREKTGAHKRFLVRVTPLQRGGTTSWCGVGTEVEEQRPTVEIASQGHEELKAVFDSVHDCYVALDRELHVTALNQTAEAWIGLSSSDLIGRDLRSIAEAVSLVADSAQAQVSTMKALRRMVEDAIHHGIQGHKQLHSALFSDRWTDLRVIPSNEGALILFRDITGQKFDQLRLTRSQGLIQSSLDSLPGRIAILDADGVIIAVNRAWRSFQKQGNGASGGAVVGANYWNHCEAPEVRRGLNVALGDRGTYTTSYDLELSTGRHCYQVTIATFEQSEFQRIVVSHEDVTELVNSKQSVADLHSRLNCIQEDERQRIAVELHDSTAQYLVAAGLNLSRLKDSLVDDGARTICEEVDGLLDEALKELRTFTYLLHPIGLSNEGLMATLHRFALGLEKRSSLHIELSLDENIDDLPFEFQRTVLRIAQEALANAHRHAHATRVDLSIDIDKALHLRVSDNGRGMPEFAWDDAESSVGVGIAGMKARVAQFGGTIDFPSGPGGTTVVATIPIRESIDLAPPPRTSTRGIDGSHARRHLEAAYTHFSAGDRPLASTLRANLGGTT
jgi:signal transduction histidine kinase